MIIMNKERCVLILNNYKSHQTLFYYIHIMYITCMHRQVYIEKKTSLYLLCDDYVLSIADGTSVSTFLCTRKLGPEEVSISLTAV